jgi:excisionase family DNA binding protein
MGEKEREYSTQEAADLLGIASRTTIWKAVQNGELKARRQGKRKTIRIAHSDLVAYAQRYNYPVPEDH